MQEFFCIFDLADLWLLVATNIFSMKHFHPSVVNGILVLLDALGTSGISRQDLNEKVKNFDQVDERVSKDISILSRDLERHHFNNRIFSGTIYDNFQIFLPIDIHNPSFVDMTGNYRLDRDSCN
jgi:hypothetical protein